MVANEPTLTWHRPSDGTVNIYEVNFRDAWELGSVEEATQLPIAVHPTNIYPRMNAQHSCFTIHGKKKDSLNAMVGDECLSLYEIKVDASEGLRELRTLGISHSTLFPEPEGLAKELEQIF